MTRIDVVGQVVIDTVFRDMDAVDASASVRQAPKSRVGGKAFNIAAAIARLGWSARLVSAVGTDLAGRDALRQIERVGVDPSLVAAGGWGWGSVATPLISLTEGRFGERQVELAADPRMKDLYRHVCEMLYARASVTEPRAIVFTLEFDDSELPMVARALRRARSRFKPIILGNPAPRREHQPSREVGELLRLADVLVPNRYEEQFLVEPGDDGQSTRRVTEIYGSTWCVTTCGRDGWRWSDGARVGAGSLPPRNVADKVGASDVFTAALTVMRICDAPIELAARFAGAAAGTAVSRSGGAERFPNLRDVLDTLESDGDAQSKAAFKFACTLS